MTTCTLPRAASLFDALDEGGTLDELIVSVWKRLGDHRAVDCPVCGDEMAPQYGAHALAIGGRCSTCESTLR